MKNYYPKNERIKREYFAFLTEAEGKSPSTVDGIRKALLRFEDYNRYKDFATFKREQAIAFKKYLAKQMAERSGKPLSKATILTTLNNLKSFFQWLAREPGYRGKIHLSDVDYLNLSEKETRVAKTTKYKSFPTLEQIHKAVFSITTKDDIMRRNQAMLALTALTGIRDSALISLKLKHIDIERALVKQEPDEVRTKFSKRIDTYFFPVGEDFERVVSDWVDLLRIERFYGYDAPLFPRTAVTASKDFSFRATGLEPEHWTTTSAVRRIFREAFEGAGLSYYNPHSFRDTLTHFGEAHCKTPEEFKAWSQNLGHESPLTTFISYGTISTHRQAELIRGLQSKSTLPDERDLKRLLQMAAERL